MRVRREFKCFLIIVVFLCASISSTDAGAQCTLSWKPSDGLPGTDGDVRAIGLWDPDGAGPAPSLLVIGGAFSVVGNIHAANVAAWDGEQWLELGSGTNGEIDAITTFNGDLILGGLFSSTGDFPANNIARWNGSTWQPLDAGVNGRVSALTVYNGELVAAGAFTSAGQAVANRIARWNGSSWQTLGTGTNNTVYSLAVYNGELIAGGAFTTAGGISATRIARWNGTTWATLGSGISGCTGSLCTPTVNALTVFNNQLVAGGNFTTAGAMSVNHVAGWNGTSWVRLGLGMDLPLKALGRYAGVLIAGGGPPSPGGPPAIAEWDGVNWTSLSSWTDGTVFTSPFIYALGSFDGELVAGGSFTVLGGVGNNNVSRWNGTLWHGFGGGFGGDSPIVRTNFVNYQGELIAAGSFIGASGVGVQSVAAWDRISWHRLDVGFPGYAYTQTVYGNELVVGGSISFYAIASWNGSQWRPWYDVANTPPSAPTITSMLVYDSQLVIGGFFDSAGNSPANSIASWDGISWDSMQGGVGQNPPYVPYVFSLASYRGTLIAGGWFTLAGGSPANYIAQWDGMTWKPLGTGTDQRVLAMTAYHGDLIAGGDFMSAGGVPAGRVARWDGSNWSCLGQVGMDGRVLTLTVYDDELIAGGYFTSADGQATDHIARWDGSTWRPFSGLIAGGEPGVSSPYVAGLGEYNGELVVGGNFSLVDGNPNAYWARWGPTCPRGDMNCDQVVDLNDVPPFIDALLNAPALTTCDAYTANVNADVFLDGTPKIDALDIQAFIAALIH